MILNGIPFGTRRCHHPPLTPTLLGHPAMPCWRRALLQAPIGASSKDRKYVREVNQRMLAASKRAGAGGPLLGLAR